MGVEYTHYLIPKNPSFQATSLHIKQAIDVLKSYGIWGSSSEVFIGLNGKFNLSSENLDPTKDGYLSSSGDLEGVKIAKVMGKSAYEEADDDSRYLQSVKITFGPSIKCHHNSECIFVDTKKLQIIECVNDNYARPPFDVIISNDQDMSPIRVVSRNDAIDKNFVGWWKFSICLDCGKDVPGWSEEMAMSNKGLISDLSAKLGVPFCEVGNYY